MIICSKCKQKKSKEEFWKGHKKNGRRAQCMQCVSAHMKQWYSNLTPEQRSARYLKFKFGLTLNDVKNMKQKQKNKCAICLKKFSRLWIDHNHITNKVRKLLCLQCNHMIGLSYENPTVLRQAARYLEIHNTQ